MFDETLTFSPFVVAAFIGLVLAVFSLLVLLLPSRARLGGSAGQEKDHDSVPRRRPFGQENDPTPAPATTYRIPHEPYLPPEIRPWSWRTGRASFSLLDLFKIELTFSGGDSNIVCSGKFGDDFSAIWDNAIPAFRRDIAEWAAEVKDPDLSSMVLREMIRTGEKT